MMTQPLSGQIVLDRLRRAGALRARCGRDGESADAVGEGRDLTGELVIGHPKPANLRAPDDDSHQSGLSTAHRQLQLSSPIPGYWRKCTARLTRGRVPRAAWPGRCFNRSPCQARCLGESCAITTGQAAWCTQRWLTDPSSASARTLCPRLPSTSRAARAEASTRTWAASPLITDEVILLSASVPPSSSMASVITLRARPDAGHRRRA